MPFQPKPEDDLFWQLKREAAMKSLGAPGGAYGGRTASAYSQPRTQQGGSRPIQTRQNQPSFGSQLAGPAAGGVVGGLTSAIPVVGPFLSPFVGAATSAAVGETMAEEPRKEVPRGGPRAGPYAGRQIAARQEEPSFGRQALYSAVPGATSALFKGIKDWGKPEPDAEPGAEPPAAPVEGAAKAVDDESVYHEWMRRRFPHLYPEERIYGRSSRGYV